MVLLTPPAPKPTHCLPPGGALSGHNTGHGTRGLTHSIHHLAVFTDFLVEQTLTSSGLQAETQVCDPRETQGQNAKDSERLSSVPPPGTWRPHRHPRIPATLCKGVMPGPNRSARDGFLPNVGTDCKDATPKVCSASWLQEFPHRVSGDLCDNLVRWERGMEKWRLRKGRAQSHRETKPWVS